MEQPDTCDKIQTIMAQTTYTEEEAKQKLDEYSGDYMKVIRVFMGIPDSPVKKQSKQQEMFRQMNTLVNTRCVNSSFSDKVNEDIVHIYGVRAMSSSK